MTCGTMKKSERDHDVLLPIMLRLEELGEVNLW